MRVKEKQQEIYFFLQETEEKLLFLEKEVQALEKQGKDVKRLDNEGIRIVRQVNYLLNEIREFGPYNDLEALLGASFEEIKNNISKSLESLEKNINDKR